VPEVISLLDHPKARGRLGADWRPSRLIAAARQDARMSVEAFASALAGMLSSPALTAGVIRAWEAGKAMPPPEAVDACLRVVACPGLEEVSPVTLAAKVAADVQVDRSPVRRRDFVLNAAALGTSLLGIDMERARALTPKRLLGSADVDVLREMTRSFKQLDNRFGGGRVHALVSHHVTHEVLPLLKDGNTRGRAERQLFAAAAELAHLAGWIAFDVADHRQAGMYLRRSLDLAEAAGASAFAGEVLAAVSHQAAFRGDGDAAVDLAQAARHQLADGDALPALVAEMWAMEAHGHALRGDSRACATAMANAERALQRADSADRPDWLGYLDVAYLAAKFGHAYRALGQPAQAMDCALRSLEMTDGYERGRLFNTTLLASAHADLGNIDAAVELGERALDMAGSVRSWRTRTRLEDLGRQLHPHGRMPAVRALIERMQLLGASGSPI
jgi:tetratricopeptide (TPR) repeat protein